jgi:hypothetical protein
MVTFKEAGSPAGSKRLGLTGPAVARHPNYARRPGPARPGWGEAVEELEAYWRALAAFLDVMAAYEAQAAVIPDPTAALVERFDRLFDNPPSS